MHFAQLNPVLLHTVDVLCEQSVMLTMMLYNSHFSHFTSLLHCCEVLPSPTEN